MKPSRLALALVTVLPLAACTAPPPEREAEQQEVATKAATTKETPAKKGIEFAPPFDGEPIDTATNDKGLVMDDFVIGDGELARAGGEVSVHYTGYLEDGTVFDTSKKRNRPFTFTLGEKRVIDGWDQGVVGMKVGGARRLVVPPELGYGDRRAGKIPPGSKLVFALELVAASPPLPPPQGDEAFAGKPIATKKLDGGLVVRDYVEGSGEPAKKGDVLVVHYTGRLKDGTVFDTSVARNKPITFPFGVGRVIKGWDQGMDGMKVGGLRKLEIPAALGYGERATGKIPANSDLVFTVELMAIKAPPTVHGH